MQIATKNRGGVTPAAAKMGKAKAALILEQPFFATILINLPMKEEPSIKTMATDGTVFLYNPDFVESLTLDELRFVLCHEVGHCVFQHMFRKGDRHHKTWNQAGDYIINDLLVKENVGKMPQGGLHNSQLVQAGGGTTEGVYEIIYQEGGGGGGGGQGKGGNGTTEPGDNHGDPLDDCMDAPGSPADKSQAEQEMKVRVAQAAQAAKMMGKLSAGMQRFVDGALKPKVDWREVLRRFVSSKVKTDASFAKPKRRFLADDIYLPSLTGEALGELVVAVDCSGSVGEKELSEFAAEVRGIVEDCKPSKLHVVYFDSEVAHHDTFLPDDDVVISPHGGGGTAFSPVMRFLDEHDIVPEACVFLTDLYCNDFGDQPAYPVLFVTTAATEAPWGEVVEMSPKM